MRFWKGLFVFAAALLVLHSCRKESEIRDSMSSGNTAGKSAFRLLSVNHIVEQIALNLSDGFFTSQTRIIKTDSSYLDGDDVEYTIDFGSGVLCTDGILRKGKCHLEVVDTLFPIKGICILSATVSDSFSMFSSKGWEKISGQFSWRKFSTDSAEIEFDLLFLSPEKYRAQTTDPVRVKYTQPITHNKNGETWNGAWKVSRDTASAGTEFTVSDLRNNGNCRSNWNSGFMEEKGVENPCKLDMDPFGNAACDQVFKISKKAKRSTDEMTFDAW